MVKSNRQQEIIKIIEEQIIVTQDDLQNALNKLGYNVTQSTVSRDIKQLRLIKGHDKDGNYRYLSSYTSNSKDERSLNHYKDIMKRSIVSVDYSLNNIVIKCYSGMAQSVAVSLESLFNESMIGAVAGDDTVLIITRSIENSQKLSNEIKEIL